MIGSFKIILRQTFKRLSWKYCSLIPFDVYELEFTNALWIIQLRITTSRIQHCFYYLVKRNHSIPIYILVQISFSIIFLFLHCQRQYDEYIIVHSPIKWTKLSAAAKKWKICKLPWILLASDITVYSLFSTILPHLTVFF